MKKTLFILLAWVLPLFCYAQYPTTGYAQVSGDGKVAAASVNPDATTIAMNVVKRGGNAVDAAIAIAFALGVVDPHNS
ncbi:MAG TPA: gamma-glutamyltransferase, partial [Cellvibrio sp.]